MLALRLTAKGLNIFWLCYFIKKKCLRNQRVNILEKSFRIPSTCLRVIDPTDREFICFTRFRGVRDARPSERWIGRGSHPEPNNLPQAAVRVEVALERHRVSDDDVRERINGDTQVTCGRESWKMLDFTAPGASFSQSISVA